ncbi:hypothetical protein F5888DRAFT_1850487 [Russula emetica]|nr:hypothetical protein F5888DRAFT_1850487 [Russula emetica]
MVSVAKIAATRMESRPIQKGEMDTERASFKLSQQSACVGENGENKDQTECEAYPSVTPSRPESVVAVQSSKGEGKVGENGGNERLYLAPEVERMDDDRDATRAKSEPEPQNWFGPNHGSEPDRSITTNGTPVENMLTHSPPLPLTVDYGSEDGITAEDEEGILLALEQRHHVRHLRLTFPLQNLRKLVMLIDEEFSILEYLIVGPPMHDSTASMLPETLQAPHLRHLMLGGFACPI